MPESESYLRMNKFILTNLKKLPKYGVLSVQNKRRSGSNVKFWLESSNMREPHINRFTRKEMLSEFHKLVKCCKSEQSMAKRAPEQRREFRITGGMQQNVLAH